MPEQLIKFRKAHPKQQEVLSATDRFITMRCGRRFGKSVVAQQMAFKALLEGKFIAYITPTYLLSKFFFDEITPKLPSCFKTHKTELTISFNGGHIKFFTGEKLDNLRSRRFHLAIVDEAAFIPNLKDGWQEAIRPTLTDYKGRAIFISTPRGKDFFDSLCNNTKWRNFHFTSYDNPFIDKDEIEDAKMALPQAVFEQEYLANPMANADNPFGQENIAKCIYPLSTKPAKFFGIDLAKYQDYTVEIGLDEDGKVSHFKRYQKSWSDTKDSIRQISKKAYGFIDATGVGDPIAEDICETNYRIEPFLFTANSKQQLIKGLIGSIALGEIGFPEGIITEELGTFEYQIKERTIQYAARQGFHDDTTIALALADKCRRENKGAGKYLIR